MAASDAPEQGAKENTIPSSPVRVEPGVGGPETKERISLVVGIGASAGGLEAFKAFFSVMPAASGMAFVLVQHLDPNHASSLVQIVASGTAMRVVSAEDGMPLFPDRVFVIPPDTILTIERGVLRLARPAPAFARRTSINTFFTSLAEDQGENAVGIILSGFGSDGALGAESIKEHGGLTLAQAEFDHAPKLGMPQSATVRGYVDHVLKVEDMPAVLLGHLEFLKKTEAAKGQNGTLKDMAEHMGAISAVLNARLGRDFSQYKPNTIMRRVQRRMQVLKIDTVAGYLDKLREQGDEPELLFREVLIRVTQFFRDPEMFDTLAQTVIAPMLAHGGTEDPIRVWVPGCATGEEVYTIGILLLEALAQAGRPRKIQIFGTDVDDRAIKIARTGLYPETIADDILAVRLDRYFNMEGDRYRVSKELREICLFSVHDLVKDPPFSKLDLISCRNLMIYFAGPLQRRVAEMFHYGLQPNGCIVLGSSETFSAYGSLFSPMDKKHSLFLRRDVPSPGVGVSLTGVIPRPSVSAPSVPGDTTGLSIARVMAQFAPPFVIIDERDDVQQFSGAISKFLEPSPGPASLGAGSLIHAELRTPLRGLLRKSRSSLSRAVASGIVFHTEDHAYEVTMVAEPLVGGGLTLVAFRETEGRPSAAAPNVPASSTSETPEHELLATQERLRTVTEELETANEELQSSNEEYQSVNEELQSTNEELETSKEELQSINEELQTLNVELNTRNENLNDINSDLANFIDSTSIPTLFLSSDLQIKRFTPAIVDIFNLRQGDQGRPITDIVSHLAEHGLEHDAREVLRTLIPLERELKAAGSERYYQMLVRPYRNVGNVISGVVVTFVDITERKRGEKLRANLAAIVEHSEDAIIAHDLEGCIVSWNAGAERIYGYTAKDAIGQPMTLLLDAGQVADWPSLLKRATHGEAIKHFESTRNTKDGRVIDVSLTISPIKDQAHNIVGASAVARDITQRKRADRLAELLLAELDHRVKNILAVVSSLVAQTLKAAGSPEAFYLAVETRIQAIAVAHSLVAQGGGHGALIDAIVSTQLAPYATGDDRLSISGADVTLTPKAAMALGMAIHELSTNAAKYGALSNPAGRVSVGWRIAGPDDKPVLRLEWSESGGPSVKPPSRKGFGSIMIERALTQEFDGTVKREFPASGLRCTIELPLTEESGHKGVPRPKEYAL